MKFQYYFGTGLPGNSVSPGISTENSQGIT